MRWKPNWRKAGDCWEASYQFALRGPNGQRLQGRQARDSAYLMAYESGRWIVRMATGAGIGQRPESTEGQACGGAAARDAALDALPGFLRSVQFRGTSSGAGDRVPDLADLEG